MIKYIYEIRGIFVNRIFTLPFLHSGPCHGLLAEKLLVGSCTIRLFLQLVQLIIMIKIISWELSSIRNPMYFFKPVAKSFTEILIDLKDLYFVP